MVLIFLGVTLNLGVDRLNLSEIKHYGTIVDVCLPGY